MRQAYAHEALLVMDPDGDDRGPGAAITVALCGRLEHEPPCPLAAHHTAAERRDGELRLRVLFATAPDRVDEVRATIDEALATGEPSRWQLIRAGCTEVSTGERPHARRLLKS